MDEVHKDKPQKPDAPKAAYQSDTPRATRIWALIGAVFMIVLTLLFAYSVASGKIFAW